MSEASACPVLPSQALSTEPRHINLKGTHCQLDSHRLATDAEARQEPASSSTRNPWGACLVCAVPEESDRERIATDAVRELMLRFAREQGRRPESIAEFSKWVEEQGDA